MKIAKVIWLDAFVEKLAVKHQVTTQEAEEVLLTSPHILWVEKGRIKGEHVYAAYGQTEAGRLLIVFFIYKGRGSVLPISGRDRTTSERRLFHEQNKAHRSYSG